MKRIVLTFGLISGAIVAGMMWPMLGLFASGTLNFDNGEVFWYATIIVALSMVFFGIKSYLALPPPLLRQERSFCAILCVLSSIK
jgi:hypothetical protein